MLTRAVGKVYGILGHDDQSAQEEPDNAHQGLIVEVAGEQRWAINYVGLTGRADPGDEVLLNTTAQTLKLGTGGFDFVVANLTRPLAPPELGAGGASGHIIKGRYLPCQQAVLTLEEQEQYAEVWEQKLGGFPVLVGQLHSQIAPAAAGLRFAGHERVAYIMTDAGALPLAFSKLVRDLKNAGLLAVTLTCGQAFGGDHETVTPHSALLAAKHILHCDAAIVCQGPGNAGTGTKYGFSGIEQAQNLDIVKALEGMPVAIVRMSSADERERHQGISHHTRTALDLTYGRCVVPVPLGADTRSLPPGHDVREVDRTWEPVQWLARLGVKVTTMGRTPDEDPIFFQAAAAAGMVV